MYSEEYKAKFLLTNLYVLVAIKHNAKTGLSQPGKTAPEKTSLLSLFVLRMNSCNPEKRVRQTFIATSFLQWQSRKNNLNCPNNKNNSNACARAQQIQKRNK